MELYRLCYKLLKRIFATGLFIAVTVPHKSRKCYINNISFLKVDVEGYEGLVFLEAIELLKEKRINLLVKIQV
jgi:hypothetical protein